MKHAHRLLAVIAAVLAASCSHKPPAGAAADNVATIDGKAISRSTFNEFVKGVAGKPAGELAPEQRTQLLENILRAEVVAAEAERSGLAAQEEVRYALEMARLQVLQRAVSQHYLKDQAPSDEEIRAEYALRVANLPRLRYRASHILVPTEDAAKQVIAQLQKGAAFAQLARASSTDAASKDRGGDLDWFTPAAVAPELAAAVQKLGKGETTTAPVQTRTGWHVIRLTDVGDNPPPSFESLREQLARYVEEKKFQAYVESLMSRSKVTRSL